MTKVERIDVKRQSILISRDSRMTAVANCEGPPPRADGWTVGVAEMTRRPPHDGEMHPDGDEFVILLSGRARLSIDSATEPLELAPGDACIIPKGEWHRFDFSEPVRLIYITPGPNGEHRPLNKTK